MILHSPSIAGLIGSWVLSFARGIGLCLRSSLTTTEVLAIPLVPALTLIPDHQQPIPTNGRVR